MNNKYVKLVEDVVSIGSSITQNFRKEPVFKQYLQSFDDFVNDFKKAFKIDITTLDVGQDSEAGEIQQLAASFNPLNENNPMDGAEYGYLTDVQLAMVLEGFAQVKKGGGIKQLSKKSRGAGKSDRLVHNKTLDKIKSKEGSDSIFLPSLGEHVSKTKLASVFSEKPDKVMDVNSKLGKSADPKSIFYDLTIPAYHGLFYDIQKKQFCLLKTCPKAGFCMIVCYAAKGGYLQYEASARNAARMLTYIMNFPEEFEKRMLESLKQAEAKADKTNKIVNMRWHDSGDFFSKGYLLLAYQIAKKTPRVIHYAYTKNHALVRDQATKKPNNFLFNYSVGGSEDRNIDLNSDKFSIIVTKDYFEDLPIKVRTTGKQGTLESMVINLTKVFNITSRLKPETKEAYSKFKVPTEEQVRSLISKYGLDGEFATEKELRNNKAKFNDEIRQLYGVNELQNEAEKELLKKKVAERVKVFKEFSDDGLVELKKRVIEKITKDGQPVFRMDTLISYDELIDKIKSNEIGTEEKKWDVLVWPGHGDKQAAMKEVRGTLLLIH